MKNNYESLGFYKIKLSLNKDYFYWYLINSVKTLFKCIIINCEKIEVICPGITIKGKHKQGQEPTSIATIRKEVNDTMVGFPRISFPVTDSHASVELSLSDHRYF